MPVKIPYRQIVAALLVGQLGSWSALASPLPAAPAEQQAAAASAPPAATPLDPLAGFDRMMADTLAAYDQPGVAVLIVKDDKVMLMKGFGVRDFATKAPVTPDTQYVWASVTKQFVSFGVGLLVDEDKLSFDKPVRNYIPDFELKDPLATQLVSLRDMLSHRTGLPRHDLLWYGNDSFTRADMIKRLRYLDLSAEPRQTWQYNNLMYMSAGYAIQQVTGKTWEQFTKERIFKPLGMTSASLSVNDLARSADHATPYERKKGVPTAIPFRNVDTLGPAGAMNGSIRDMVPWLRVHLNDGKLGDRQIISPGVLQTLHSPQIPFSPGLKEDEIGPGSYAMGFFTESYRGHWRVQHGGNLDGFTSRVTLFPDEKLGIVVLANMNVSALPELITRTLTDRYLGLPPRDWLGEGLKRLKDSEAATTTAQARKGELAVKGTSPSHPLASYAGTFTHPGYGDIVITDDGKALSGKYNSFAFRLAHKHYDIFEGQVDGQDETFKDLPFSYVTDVDGRVSTLLVPLENAVKAIEFTRKASKANSDPKVLDTYAGTYVFQGRDYIVSASGEQLLLAGPGQAPAKLEPGTQDGYFSISGVTLRFRTEGGKVTAIEQLAPDGIYTLPRKP